MQMKNRAPYLTNFQVDLCCGCRACEQSCPKKAINMAHNIEGFLYPIVDEDICINCGICDKVCPISHDIKYKTDSLKVYAAYNLNRQDRKKSSSGGIFIAIAKEILNRKGVVYGAAFDNNLNLCHIGVNNELNLEKLLGSKYVQSDTLDTFRKIKQDLIENKWVYFVGTPCQVAGLKAFLKKEYDRLITSDLVCHGVPSIKIFKLFVGALEKKWLGKIIDYRFRDKRVNGWSCSSSALSISQKGKEQEHMYDKIMNSYQTAFLSSNINREVCYKCPFACKKRCGDITIADYWGIKTVFPNIDYRDGVSVISLNTNKAINFFNDIKEELYLCESQYEVAAKAGGNHQMIHPSIRPKYRDYAYDDAFSNPNKFISQFYSKHEAKNHLIFCIKKIIKSNEFIYKCFKRIKSLINKI